MVTDWSAVPIGRQYQLASIFDSHFTLIFQQETSSGAGQVTFWELSTLVALFYGECVNGALSGSWIGWWVLVYSSGGIGLDLLSSTVSGVACPFD